MPDNAPLFPATTRANLYRDRAAQFSALADMETAQRLKARYLALATSWHDLAIASEQGWLKRRPG